MIQIQFFSLIRILLKREAIEIPWTEDDTVQCVLDRVQAQIKTPFLHKLLDENGEPHAGTIILVNRKNILHLEGLQTPVTDNDVLAFFPPGAGG
ncbi:MAG: MoaD/ThiS family protein [Desulfuromonadales bacterium]|nr:MoaD/ThiS family protein [Desulfuromonadales bacterium]